jgi:hypothetical protein
MPASRLPYGVSHQCVLTAAWVGVTHSDAGRATAPSRSLASDVAAIARGDSELHRAHLRLTESERASLLDPEAQHRICDVCHRELLRLSVDHLRPYVPTLNPKRRRLGAIDAPPAAAAAAVVVSSSAVAPAMIAWQPHLPVLFGSLAQVVTDADETSWWPPEWADASVLRSLLDALPGDFATFTRAKCQTKSDGDAAFAYRRVKDSDAAARTTNLDRYLKRWEEVERPMLLTRRADAPVRYLVDLELDQPMHDQILAAHPVAREFGPFGRRGANQWLPSGMRRARAAGGQLLYPRFKTFWCPPTHQRISTATHADECGYAVTVHLVPPASGANMRNRVRTWSRAEAGHTEDTSALYRFDATLCQALDMRPTGASKGTVSAWWADLEAQMLALGRPAVGKPAVDIPLGSVHLVGRGQSIIQPPGLLHHYQKECVDPGASLGSDNWQREGEGDMLIGVAGTDLLFGGNEEEAKANIGILLAHESKAAAALKASKCERSYKESPFVPESIDMALRLGIFCAAKWPVSLVFGVAQRAHFRAAVPFIDALVEFESTNHETIGASMMNSKTPKPNKKFAHDFMRQSDIDERGLPVSGGESAVGRVARMRAQSDGAACIPHRCRSSLVALVACTPFA